MNAISRGVHPFALIAILAATGACSRATTLELRDGRSLHGELVQTEDSERYTLDTDSGVETVLRSEVVGIARPGTGLRRIGGTMFGIGALSLAPAVGAMVREDPAQECRWCGPAVAVTLVPAGIGLFMLLHGTSLRTQAERRLRFDPRPVGRAHARLGGTLLGVGLAGTSLGLTLANTGESDASVIGGAMLFVICASVIPFGIGYLVRGGRIRRGRSSSVAFGPDGLRFDLSL
ncbi:MAG: hypothetical protein JJ863_06335 [Deltaproteobacteria bacterium]|nr:hypothetical protein [Deltaproteobacteria bacterium]